MSNWRSNPPLSHWVRQYHGGAAWTAWGGEKLKQLKVHLRLTRGIWLEWVSWELKLPLVLWGASALVSKWAEFVLSQRWLLCPLLTCSARSHAEQGQGHGWWCASALMEKGFRIWAVKSLTSHQTESSAMCRTVLEMLPGVLVLGARYDHKLFLFVNRFVDIP